MKTLQKYLNIPSDGILGPQTKQAAEFWARERYRAIGLKWPKKGLVELRQSQTFTNRFSDHCLIIEGGKVADILPWTTKPGLPGVLDFAKYNKTGVGVVCENQPRQWRWSTKPNKYGSPMGIQYEPINVYRDGNKDNKIDKNIVEVAPTDKFFQLHQQGIADLIGWNSLGCRGCKKGIWDERVVPRFNHGEMVECCILDM